MRPSPASPPSKLKKTSRPAGLRNSSRRVDIFPAHTTNSNNSFVDNVYSAGLMRSEQFDDSTAPWLPYLGERACSVRQRHTLGLLPKPIPAELHVGILRRSRIECSSCHESISVSGKLLRSVCQRGFGLTPPEKLVIESRPAYGGTCYSPFTVGSTTTAIAYDSDGSTRLQPWVATTSGANAYAHPIDGFAENVPSLFGCNTPTTSMSSNSSSAVTASSLSSTATLSNETPAASNTSKISNGTIAGAAVGGFIGLAAIVGLVFFLLRRRHRGASSASNVHQIDDNPSSRAEKDGKVISGEMHSDVPVVELAARPDKYAYVQGAHELNAGVAHEMPAGPESSPSRDPFANYPK
ncbi:hypothetical protein OPT61_g2691 [Boeremia exigua]|uniref:Uncharacterized protein n=1 Tax=Boeremia exigua TaxID=749465 RepID=A0ACC2IKS6_9PLEO|nr:hypothetical protein OPT61_g2691 [Boeremia exigua]